MWGQQDVLQAVAVAVVAGTGESLGFLMDANDDLGRSRESVASHMRKAGVQFRPKFSRVPSLGSR